MRMLTDKILHLVVYAMGIERVGMPSYGRVWMLFAYVRFYWGEARHIENIQVVLNVHLPTNVQRPMKGRLTDTYRGNYSMSISDEEISSGLVF